jgi:NAD(P)-dependent dehydrogenase (short-subunit alcohol dehydrogenase family)
MRITDQKVELPPWLKKFSLEGKIAVITGAGSGLGREVAAGMAMSGATVLLLDRNAQAVDVVRQELCDAGLRAASMEIDVTCAGDVRRFVGWAMDTYGKIDILANIAGISKRMPTEDFDEDAFDQIVDVNLKGSFLTLKYVGREMLKQGFGSIINFGSLASVVAIPESVAYSCSKGGVAQLTRTAGVEWASRGVRVNAIIPGTFTTPLLQQCIDKQPDYGEVMLRRFPIGRFGDPEEIVGACIYLASDASTYTTGLLLAVDGGCTAF